MRGNRESLHPSSFSLNAIPSEIPPQQSKSVPTLTKFLILFHGSLLLFMSLFVFCVSLQPFEVREDKNIASFVFFLATPTSNESIVGTK